MIFFAGDGHGDEAAEEVPRREAHQQRGRADDALRWSG